MTRVTDGIVMTVNMMGQENRTECILLRIYGYSSSYDHFGDMQVCWDLLIPNDTTPYASVG